MNASIWTIVELFLCQLRLSFAFLTVKLAVGPNENVQSPNRDQTTWKDCSEGENWPLFFFFSRFQLEKSKFDVKESIFWSKLSCLLVMICVLLMGIVAFFNRSTDKKKTLVDDVSIVRKIFHVNFLFCLFVVEALFFFGIDQSTNRVRKFFFFFYFPWRNVFFLRFSVGVSNRRNSSRFLSFGQFLLAFRRRNRITLDDKTSD